MRDDYSKYEGKGLESHQLFKRGHYVNLPSNFWAIDLDLLLMGPSGPIALIDFKANEHAFSFPEALAYAFFTNQANLPVYIIKSGDPENGPFMVYKLEISIGGDTPKGYDYKLIWQPYVGGWDVLEQWEKDLRGNHGNK